MIVQWVRHLPFMKLTQVLSSVLVGGQVLERAGISPKFWVQVILGQLRSSAHIFTSDVIPNRNFLVLSGLSKLA